MNRRPSSLAWLVGLLLPLALPLTGCVATAGSADEATQITEAATSVCGQTTVRGVDISHYDGTIDWATAKSSGIDFGFAKATESTNYTDPTFATNWAAMKAAGVARGAYHFFHADVDPTMQATYFLGVIGTLGANDLPPVLDLETANGQSQATIAANAATFLKAVTQATGKTAIVYVSPSFLSDFSALAPYKLWIANWGVTCPTVPASFSTWEFWQYSSTGTVSGIPGATAVDLDYFNGTLAQLGGGSGSSSGGGSGSSSGSGSGGGSGSSSGAGSSSGGGSGSSSGAGTADAGGSGSGGGSDNFAGNGNGGGCSVSAVAPAGGGPVSAGFAFAAALAAVAGRRRSRRAR